ncbi:MAG: YkgJ family cysteine cluster protein [Bacteroidia bacterium]
MILEYENYLKQATAKKSENKKFLDKLKKQKPKDLDIICNQYHEEVFENIDCLKCANCCSGTGPLFLDKDIDRLAKHLRLRPSEFTENYLRIDEDNDYVFKSVPCPFLGTDKYCSVYESRPNACREFPHTQQRNMAQKMSITYLNTMICPAVYLVVEKLKNYYK